MTSVNDWRETFGLANAKAPEIFTNAPEAVGEAYGWAIEHGLAQGVTAYLTVQGRPRAAIVSRNTNDNVEFKSLWKMLWNQGLASVLILHLPGHIKIYSLHEEPSWVEKRSKLEHIFALEFVRDTLKCQQTLIEIQEGRFFEGDNAKWFQKSARVDARLLGNLDDALKRLCTPAVGLEEEQGQALLLQVLFLAYLEDRKIIDGDYIKNAIKNGKHDNFMSILRDEDTESFHRLFIKLQKDFNGDVFQSPLAIGNIGEIRLRQLNARCLTALRDFREGSLDAKSGQFSFWPYDFSHIPVELLSAVYNRFMETDLSRRNKGIYYTPAFLAQVCVNLAFDKIKDNNILNQNYTFLDPACGSAIFLVCIFQRLVDCWRKEHGAIPGWQTLLAMLGRLHGWDKDSRALRVGLISLYIALLEKMEPSAIEELRKDGKILPKLLGTTILQRNFFDTEFSDTDSKYGLVIGNPPWVSRKIEEAEDARNWCKLEKFPMPAEQVAWAFLWKALATISEDGQIALLLPATGVLFNEKAKDARKLLFETKQISRIVNFSDLCFQLFEGANAPAILLQASNTQASTFEYWVPKTNPAFLQHKSIFLTRQDRMRISVREVFADDRVLSRRAWGSSRDISLLSRLDDMTRLSEQMVQYGDLSKRAKDYPPGKLVIGQGFKPAGEKTPPVDPLEELTKYNFIEASHGYRWTLPEVKQKWKDSIIVHRLGFRDGYKSPHILLNQGVERSTGLLRAVYSEQNLCFQHSLQAIWSPEGNNEANFLKVLTAFLNSKLAAWYLFHTADNLGVERFAVRQHEYLDLPFPLRSTLHDSIFYQNIINLIDRHLLNNASSNELLSAQTAKDFEFENAINNEVYNLFGLRDGERQLINDSMEYIIPSNQPNKSLKPYPKLWEFPDKSLLTEYATWLRRALKANYAFNTCISVKIHAVSSQMYLVEIVWNEEDGIELNLTSSRYAEALASELLALWPGGGLIHHLLDLALCIKNRLYLVRPARVRHFVASNAIIDSDNIIADLMLHTSENMHQ